MVWTPGQSQHCQEMCICMNETLNPQQMQQKLRFWFCPHLVSGVCFPSCSSLITPSVLTIVRAEPGSLGKPKMWVCSFLERQAVKESIRAGAQRCMHVVPPSPPLLFFHAEQYHGNNKVPQSSQSSSSRSQRQYTASGHHLLKASQLDGILLQKGPHLLPKICSETNHIFKYLLFH